MPTTILRLGEKRDFFLLLTCLMKPLIIISAALKSAITPFLRGLMVLIPGFVCSCMSLACLPIAMHLPELLSIATMLGASMTISSFLKMTVLAVPRSIAIS
ncbi:unknown [Alistipes sp. CAG:514]|nr:unknown [Alistipes sp. CAG:514]